MSNRKQSLFAIVAEQADEATAPDQFTRIPHEFEGIKGVDFTGAYGYASPQIKSLENQFNQCIAGTIDIHDLQEWMIDAGYSQLAKL